MKLNDFVNNKVLFLEKKPKKHFLQSCFSWFEVVNLVSHI